MQTLKNSARAKYYALGFISFPIALIAIGFILKAFNL